MKKILTIVFLFLFSNASYANDAKINEFTKWLLDNGHTQYVKEGDICKEYKKYSKEWYDSRCEEFPKGKMGIISNLDINFYKYNEIPEFSKPNKDTALYYLYRGQKVARGNSRAGSTKSDNPYKFEISLRADDDKTLKKVRKAMNKTSMLSYLLYEDGKITIDEITPLDRFGILYENYTVHTSASVGKSLVSYVTGHAICEGYISSIDHKLNDWELLENTLFYDQKLIDLMNMAAGHHQYADKNIKTDGLYPTNSNKNTIAFHMKDGVFKNSKKSKSKYQYTNCLLYTSPSPRDKRQSRMPSSA